MFAFVELKGKKPADAIKQLRNAVSAIRQRLLQLFPKDRLKQFAKFYAVVVYSGGTIPAQTDEAHSFWNDLDTKLLFLSEDSVDLKQKLKL